MAKRLITIVTTSLALLGSGAAWGDAPFVDNGDGTVTDTSTGLMWDQCSLGQSGADCATGPTQNYTWAEANAQAAPLNSGAYKGHSDWRLPSLVQLVTLVKGTTAPAIDTVAFPATLAAKPYWSGSTHAPAPANYAWYVYFDNGSGSYFSKNAPLAVRLVRGGQCPDSFALLPVSVAVYGASTATLTATSVLAATGYWMVLPHGAVTPSIAQIKAPGSYSAATVAASGNAVMTAKAAHTFVIIGLTQGSTYDVYLVAQDTAYAQTSCMAASQFSTQPAAIATRSIVIDPATPANVYAALDGAGVYRSTDSGANWSAATTQPGNLNLKALVIKPGSPATLFAASYGGGAFKSTDSAATWAACATQPTSQNLLSLAIDTNGRLYVGSEAGVFVSSNDCAAWSAMNTGLPN